MYCDYLILYLLSILATANNTKESPIGMNYVTSTILYARAVWPFFLFSSFAYFIAKILITLYLRSEIALNENVTDRSSQIVYITTSVCTLPNAYILKY